MELLIGVTAFALVLGFGAGYAVRNGNPVCAAVTTTVIEPGGKQRWTRTKKLLKLPSTGDNWNY
jgi:hypothetical protein